ncbi:hypothetical protein [Tuwongella immobilis]|uniref:Uncharacterized protein n=1 Tax=Tuwongella immobilis TaxID=692036 RepID=A0A6C2YWZ5_9BACT|nr:hypothetical protein [Tuwongella immobilis]VIP05663.1 Uncharacterized protein OS=Pirellula staleyi (strain ATCC 27377 / DSM 6068 / ICPB 4128) GN=Psta_1601 PE=4 SV=1 [Tuwongella immobilis]VTS08682.1 Uncharacterized protein OS=Pirellula staleyi (strain ATCC 27377 / DSM 6068 / ICPB 4128) GN=Psta_1601 PE=4 SV=1 [Tuwongella immobilis]
MATCKMLSRVGMLIGLLAGMLGATGGMLVAADAPGKERTTLDLSAKTVQRFEANQSQIGYTSTRLFYTLADQRVVIVLSVDNSKKGFPVSGKLYQFAKDVTPEGLAKWLNNQHSDGLYPEVPEPKSVVNLPAEACQSGESKVQGQKRVLETTYQHHRVTIKLTDVNVGDQFRLSAFTDTANVYQVVKQS